MLPDPGLIFALALFIGTIWAYHYCQDETARIDAEARRHD